MDDEQAVSTRAVAERVIELEEEVEASGYASIGGSALEEAKSALHRWVDEMTGVVISPGLGRVTVIHGNGRPSTIASAHLTYMMSKPLGSEDTDSSKA